ncbi:tetratricopeptide repeat protein 7B-like [Styela clava]
MSSKRHKIENEIIKHRNEGSCSKIDEASKLLSKKCGSADPAVLLLEGEVKLETYLQENPPRRENVAKSKKDLAQLKVKLQEVMASECKDTLFDIKKESCLLLCRLLYAQGNTKACINMMKNLDLEKMGQEEHCYQIRLVSEVYAIKGLCLEHSRLKFASGEILDDKEIIQSYERSTEIAFDYIAEFERLQGQGLTAEPPISHGMELAFQRGPLLHMKNGDVEIGIEKLRKVLQSKITSSVQQTLARDLATVLIRGISDVTYKSPTSTQNGDDPEGSKAKKLVLKHGGGSPTATFTISPIERSFSPTDCTQESILLLIISETMFNTDPILDMSPEYSEARSELLRNSRTLYDLLAVALGEYSQYEMFAKSIEASLKYAYKEFHIWFQYGLSLQSAGRLDRAVRVFMECSQIRPENPAPYLLAAKICFESLNDIETGIDFAKKALNSASVIPQNDDENENFDDYLSAVHLAVGMGYSYLCVDGTPRNKVKELRSKAILHFNEGHNVDPQDYKPLLFMAVEMALDRRINDAITHVKEALELQPYDLNCLHLLVLLLTAQKQFKKAFTILETACKFYPENINLLFTKCKMEMYVGRDKEALCTCHSMAQIYKTLHEARESNAMNTEAMLDRLTSDGLSVTNQSIGNELDLNDGGSFIGSVAASRMERGLSDIESSLGNFHPMNVGISMAHPSLLQAHIWLITAEVYLTLQRFDEAGQCVQEASALFPLSHSVLYTRGRLAQCRGDQSEACTMYENTITINPKHYKALWEWAKILIDQKQLEFAKKLLQDAVKLNPMSHEIWLCLGDVLQELEDADGSVECMTMAINIEATSPVVPFTTVSRDL